MSSRILAKASAAAAVASLALASGAEAHSSSNGSYAWTKGFAETKLDRAYRGDAPHACLGLGRRIQGRFYAHFTCADGEHTFRVHVTSMHGFKLSNFRSY